MTGRALAQASRGLPGRVVVEQQALKDLRNAERRRRLALPVDAVEAATQELYSGTLSLREGEALAGEIRCARAEILTLKQELAAPSRF